jgi:NAD(P)-dependent dehydrogenase (short-subunit alcohol dehydrogenase family)
VRARCSCDYRQMIEVNLLGAITSTEVFLDQLTNGGGGDIHNISSVAGRTARPTEASSRPPQACAIGICVCAAMSSALAAAWFSAKGDQGAWCPVCRMIACASAPCRTLRP